MPFIHITYNLLFYLQVHFLGLFSSDTSWLAVSIAMPLGRWKSDQLLSKYSSGFGCWLCCSTVVVLLFQDFRLPELPNHHQIIMPRMAKKVSHLMIRFALHGCTNRPFYHIVLMPNRANRNAVPMEQIGTYDPMPNTNQEKLVAINFERLKYWLACGAQCSRPVEKLLGVYSITISINIIHIHSFTFSC